MSIFVVLGLSATLLLADEKVQITNTQQIDFTAGGGTLRLKNSIGVLTIEGWDQPEVEVTTIKSTKREYQADERDKAARGLDKVHVATQRQGNELIITTDFRRYHAFPPPYPMARSRGFDLEYHIKAPRNTRLVVEHDIGEINVENLTNDIDASLLQGEIMLHLPEEGEYAVRAKSDFGHVNSDFQGTPKRTPWLFGHRVNAEPSRSPNKLNLKVGRGDIVILKTRVPKEPAPLTRAPTPSGQ